MASEIGADNVDVHKPKPAHTAKEFLFELLTVTIGILIALSLEALVEQYRTHRLVDYTRADFKSEIEHNRSKLMVDLRTSRVTQENLERVMSVAQDRLDHKEPASDTDINLSRTFVLLRSAAWSSALSTQVMGHFPHAEGRAIAEAYSDQEEFSATESAAQQAWFALAGYAAHTKGLTDSEVRQGLRDAATSYAYLVTLEDGERRLLATYDQTLKTVGR